VSAPEAGIALASCPADVVELAAFRGRDADLGQLAAARGLTLPGLSSVVAGPYGLTLSVRPGRWLLLSPPASAGESAARWAAACQGCGAAVDLSSALAAFLLRGPAVAPVLARACRLDLDTFPSGTAAATIMVQVPAILARLTPGMLLLTPATTAQHLREWLVETSRPFGLAQDSDAAVSDCCGESST
jgi:heterotetrameric sarcosine oxidase gamma subunit